MVAASKVIKQLILLKKFAYIETLSHKLPYTTDKFNNGDTIEVLGYTGKLHKAKIHRIPIDNPSIVANILEIESDDPYLPNRVEIIWRGTHDVGSAIADLDPVSPGYSSYMKNRLAILTEINQAINRLSKDGKSVNVGVYGHSLGGSLAQVCATDIMDVMVQNNNDNLGFNYLQNDLIPVPKEFRNNFNNVKNLEIGTFNSAGVSKDTASRASSLSKYLHNNSVKITYFAGLNEGDIVQKTGEATILADSTVAEVNLLKTNVETRTFYNILKGVVSVGDYYLSPIFGPVSTNIADIINNKLITTANAHTAVLFDDKYNIQSDIINFELYQNINKRDRKYIINELNYKSKKLQHPIIKTMQATVHYYADQLMDRYNSLYAKPAVLFNNKLATDNSNSWGNTAWWAVTEGYKRVLSIV
jgi:hypothetical protein